MKASRCLSLFLLAWIAGGTQSTAAPSEAPNLLFIFADDLSYRNIGACEAPSPPVIWFLVSVSLSRFDPSQSITNSSS